MRKILLIQFSFFILFFLNLYAENNLTFYYFEREPYYFTDSSGNAKGILIEKAKQICNIAKLNCKFVSVPNKRILAYLQNNKFSCSIGWFYSKKRSKIFKYSKVIYESKPIIAIFNSRKFTRGIKTISLDNLFKENFKLGLISGFKYGKILDNKIKSYKNKIRYTTTMDTIIKLTAYGRVDFTLVSEENFLSFIKKNPYLKKFLIPVHIKEIKKGERRYIICSKKTPDIILKKLNQAIITLQ